tara:strand:- start:8317 stop:11307 length:2991 start_codon:yes stop_codon:yes gene_type:complete
MSLGRRFVSTGAADAVCLTESVQVFGADSTYSSNKLLYQFENDVTNDVGTPSATNSGATFSSTAKFGSYSADFAGTTQHIDTEYNTDDTALTHSFWMYQHSITGSYNAILGTYWNGGGSGLYGYYLWSSDGTTLNWTVHTSNAAYVQVSGTVSLNAWHHVVLTWSDGVGASIYIDGSLAEFTASSLARQKNDETITLGNLDTRGTSTVGYDGLLDQYRYYNKAVSDSDAYTLYSETTDTVSNTNLLNEGAGLALYSLDYDASDASGYYDGTPTDVDFGVGGQINTGARFNGSSSKITLSSTISSIKTYSFWIKPDSSGNATYARRLFGDVGGTSYTNSITFDKPNSKVIYYEGTTARSSATISNDAWSHIAFTSDGTTLKVYTNGSLSNTYTTSGFNSSINEICSTSSNRQFTGSLDQIRIFSKALDSTEVSTLYAETACVHTATTTDNYYPTTNLAYYKFDNSAEDSVGTNDGTETDIEYRFGKYGQAAVFNGSSSEITINSFTTPSNNCTTSLWFKANSQADNQFILALNNTKRQAIRLNSTFNDGNFTGSTGADGRISYLHHITGQDPYLDSASGLWEVNRWYHLVVQKSSTDGAKIWLDGVEIASSTNTTDFPTVSGNNVIGSASGSLYFDGQIDQLRFFNSFLSEENILKLFNEKPETDTSNFKTVLYEGSGAAQYVSNVGMDLETNGGLVWIKKRSGGSTRDHMLYDSVRGAGNRIRSNQTTAASNATDELTSFDANGFFLGSSDAVNGSSSSPNYVAWTWLAGKEAVAGTGTGVTNVSVSANTDAGFSIVKFTGGSGSGQTVKHGLNSEPEIYFLKGLDNGTDSWIVCGNSTIFSSPTTNFLRLNTNDSVGSTTANHVGSNGDDINVQVRNYNGLETIAYCWHSVTGYSKIGTYEGTNSTVTVSDVGFKPSFVMIKNVDDTGDWVMLDNRRNTIEDRLNNWLRANSNAQETGAVSTAYITVNDSGFIVANTTSLGTNSNGDTYLYMAFK